MQTGSLVVVKPCKNGIHPELLPHISWFPLDDEKTIYTIRFLEPGTDKKEHTFAAFEEGVIGCMNHGELTLNTDYLKEIQPPMDISELIEEAIYAMV